MIDLHSHILPCVDDGSSSVDESIALLKMLSEQGVDLVCATPHFDPSRDTPASFLVQRQHSYEKLISALPEPSPKIVLGAEVMFFSGISGMKELSVLSLDGTKLLLLEMPMMPWSDYTLRELMNLAASGSVRIVLAHFERYLVFQKADVWDRLARNGVLLQSNASFFINPKTRRKALKMLKNGQIHFIGSDCHNTGSRSPKIDEAMSIIENKLGKQIAEEIDSFGKSFFGR